MGVPGVGPVISTGIVAAIGTGEAFERGRDFGAWSVAVDDADEPPSDDSAVTLRLMTVALSFAGATSARVPRPPDPRSRCRRRDRCPRCDCATAAATLLLTKDLLVLGAKQHVYAPSIWPVRPPATCTTRDLSLSKAPKGAIMPKIARNRENVRS